MYLLTITNILNLCYSEPFISTNLFSLTTTQGGTCYDYALFIDEETEAQSGEVICLETQN